jgi:hypothetical protein
MWEGRPTGQKLLNTEAEESTLLWMRYQTAHSEHTEQLLRATMNCKGCELVKR